MLGQASFAHNGVNLIDGTGFSTPWGVALDPSVTANRLYVVDPQNSRVLAYDNATDIDYLGLATPSSASPTSSPTIRINSTARPPTTRPPAPSPIPLAAVVDSSGDLFVADTGNSRVLVFVNPLHAGQLDGFLANFVIGQNGSSTTGQNGVFNFRRMRP